MDLIGWAIFIVALLVSVMLHETGHFLVAKRFGSYALGYLVVAACYVVVAIYGLRARPQAVAVEEVI